MAAKRPWKLRLLEWVAHRLPPCREVARLVSQSNERRLRVRERLSMRLHYWICTWCRRYRDQLELIRTAAPTMGNPGLKTAAHSLPEETRKRLKRRLREASRNFR